MAESAWGGQRFSLEQGPRLVFERDPQQSVESDNSTESADPCWLWGNTISLSLFSLLSGPGGPTAQGKLSHFVGESYSPAAGYFLLHLQNYALDHAQ